MDDDNATIFSDSTTLVDPSQKRYRLQQDNPCNTIISSPARRPLYSVETTFEGETLTTVRKLATDQQQATASAQEGEFVASLRWNDVLDDKVKVGNASSERLRKILGIQWINLAHTANFKDAEGRKYQWQGYAPGMVLKVCYSFYTLRPLGIPPAPRTPFVLRHPMTLLIAIHNSHSFTTLKTQPIPSSSQRFTVHGQVSKQVYASQHIWKLNHVGHRSSTQLFGASCSWRRIEGLGLGPSMELKHRLDRFLT